jgi:hypothetical protein
MAVAAHSEYLANALLNEVLRNVGYTPVANVYVALYTTDDPEGGVEVAAVGAYARVAVTFGAASGKRVTNSAAVNFAAPTADWGDIRSFAILDASALGTGNILYKGVVDEIKRVRNGDPAISFAVGEIEVELT